MTETETLLVFLDLTLSFLFFYILLKRAVVYMLVLLISMSLFCKEKEVEYGKGI